MTRTSAQLVNEETGQAEPYIASMRNPVTGLTFKQEEFCQAIVHGQGIAQAYKTAFNTETMQPSTINSRALELAKQSRIKERIQAIGNQIDAETRHDPATLRRVALNTLLEIAECKQAKHNDRARAAELLGKVNTVQLFNDITTIKTERVTDAEAVAKLKSILGTYQVIETKE